MKIEQDARLEDEATIRQWPEGDRREMGTDAYLDIAEGSCGITLRTGDDTVVGIASFHLNDVLLVGQCVDVFHLATCATGYGRCLMAGIAREALMLSRHLFIVPLPAASSYYGHIGMTQHYLIGWYVDKDDMRDFIAQLEAA